MNTFESFHWIDNSSSYITAEVLDFTIGEDDLISIGNDGVCGERRKLLIGGDNLISGDSWNDSLWGDNDSLYSDFSNDYICGNSGNDSLYSDFSNDCIYGNSGNDSLYSDFSNDCIYGNSGNDSLYSDFSNDCIYGNSGNDAITRYTSTDYDIAENISLIIDEKKYRNPLIVLTEDLRRYDFSTALFGSFSSIIGSHFMGCGIAKNKFFISSETNEENSIMSSMYLTMINNLKVYSVVSLRKYLLRVFRNLWQVLSLRLEILQNEFLKLSCKKSLSMANRN